MKGFKDKQAPLSTTRRTSGNAGSPKNREVHGDGVPIVVGARESLVRGEGEQVRQWIDQLVARDAPVCQHKRTGRPLETGKPDADESRTSGLGRGGWKRAADERKSDISSLSQNRAGHLLYPRPAGKLLDRLT
jgi:hypothetical protein